MSRAFADASSINASGRAAAQASALAAAAHGSESPARLTLATLDPRSLFPTEANIAAVTLLIERVEAQLEEDRARFTREPQSAQAREIRNETLAYFGLLNDWIAQATALSHQLQQQQMQAAAVSGSTTTSSGTGSSSMNPMDGSMMNGSSSSSSGRRRARGGVRMEEGREGMFPVVMPGGGVDSRKCLVDDTRQLYYVQVNRIRDTIYGCVKLYVIGRMDKSGGGPGAPAIRLLEPVESVAVKVYEKELVNSRKSRDGHPVQEDPLRELAIQQRLSNPGHRYVMPLLACLESEARFFAIFPYIRGGELFDFVHANAPLPEKTARSMMRVMLDATHYCHTAGVCHRDISLENFLLGGDHNMSPLLIDFGLSVVMEPSPSSSGTVWKPIPASVVGKLLYMAPEVLDSSSATHNGCAIDVWCLGVCLFIMLTGVPPWDSPNPTDTRFRHAVVKQQLASLLTAWNMPVSADAVKLMQAIFNLDPLKRPTIEEIAKAPWMVATD